MRLQGTSLSELPVESEGCSVSTSGKESVVVAERGYPGNCSKLCHMDSAQNTQMSPGWIFQFPPQPPAPFLLSFQNQDIYLFIGSRLMSALITLPTLNSLPTPKCPQGIHMEVSHSLRVSWVLKVTSHGARCSLIPQGALEDAGFNGHLSWQASLQLHKLPKEMAHHQRIAFPLGIISLVLVDFLLDLAWPHFVSYSPCITIVITAFFFF